MDIVERVARAICKADGDEWTREGAQGLMEAYGPLARAAIRAMRVAAFKHSKEANQ